MKTTRIAKYALAGIALFLAAGQVGAGAQAINPPPALVSFQGRLAKPDGTPVVDGNTYSVTLSLWDAQSGGAKRWEQTFSGVTVRNGVFAVLLNLNSGFTSGNTLDTTLNNATYLQVQVGTSPALTPRQQLVSNAYALKAATVADGSISISKLNTALKNSVLGGAAGGDLTGSYPNPLIKTDSSLLNKVSGGLLSVAAASSAVDQGQTSVTNTVTSSAWQSFEPGSTGTLVEIDVNAGTTGAALPATLTLYDGIGTGGAILQTIPITIQPSQGLQSFPITASVIAGHDYTWSIGSNNNLTFGYAGGKPYVNGVSDLGSTFSYAFQTRMRVTTAPATQINTAATLLQTGSYYLAQNNSVGPMLVKQYDPFTSGTYNGAGRSGLFQAASDILFGGMANTSTGPRSIRFGTWSADSATRTDILSILNNGNVGIKTTTPTSPLHVAGDSKITGKTYLGANPSTSDTLNIDGSLRIAGTTNGIIFGDGTKQTTAPVFSGAPAGGDLTGTFPNPTIAANRVDNTKLASDAASLNKVSGGAMTSSGGNIGIGTTAPESPLHVANINGITVGQSGTSGGYTALKLGLSAASGGNAQIQGIKSAGSAYGDLALNPNGGNVGVGTAPASAYKLDVAGNTQIQGQLVMGGGLTDYAQFSMQLDTSGGGNLFECINATISGPRGIAVIGSVNAANGYGVEGRNFGGGIAVHAVGRAGGSSGWENLSDARFKTNVQTFPDALSTVLNLRGVTFDWKRNDYPKQAFPAGQQVGFIAQEVEKVLPQIVNVNNDGYRSVMYASVVPVLVEAMKQQQQQIEALQSDNAALKKQAQEIKELKKQMIALTSLLQKAQSQNATGRN